MGRKIVSLLETNIMILLGSFVGRFNLREPGKLLGERWNSRIFRIFDLFFTYKLVIELNGGGNTWRRFVDSPYEAR